MTKALSITGDLLTAGRYDVTAAMTSGTAEVQRSFDGGVNYEVITDANWVVHTTVSMGPLAKALYKAIVTGDATITMRKVKT